MTGIVVGGMLYSCGSADREQSAASSADILSGEQLSRQYCQSCHLYPEPGTLDKHTWERSVLPLMGRRFGIYEENVPRSTILEGAIDKDLVRRLDIFPEKPRIDEESWEKISDYYLSSAPDALPKKQDDPVPAPLEGFEVIVPAYKTSTPLTTLVEIDEKHSTLYVGGAQGNAGALALLNTAFRMTDGVKLPSPPVDITVHGDALSLTLVGALILQPAHNPTGQLLHISRRPGDNRYSLGQTFQDPLRRPLQTVFDDINGDGREDLLVADFGYYTGALTLYENGKGAGGGFKKTMLKSVPGAMRVYARDMNADGRKDIVALFAQGDEGISVFYNNGDGTFREERVLRFNPAYGSVYFELADMNQDGHVDILYCNGDNGDYPPILKNYHGIRIFENDGKNNFRQVFFYPMYGAYKCSAADFDRDGDLDIAGISYFPDPASSPRRDFIYLRNEGSYSFTPQSLQKDIPARWVTFDVGDLDKDGYPDIVLGATGTHRVVDAHGRRTSVPGPSLVFLRNLGKR